MSFVKSSIGCSLEVSMKVLIFAISITLSFVKFQVYLERKLRKRYWLTLVET
jgi:hypothetical protein